MSISSAIGTVVEAAVKGLASFGPDTDVIVKTEPIDRPPHSSQLCAEPAPAQPADSPIERNAIDAGSGAAADEMAVETPQTGQHCGTGDNSWVLNRKIRVYTPTKKITIKGLDIKQMMDQGDTLRAIADIVFKSCKIPVEDQLIKIRGETSYLNDPEIDFFPLLGRRLVGRILGFVDSALEVSSPQSSRRAQRSRTPAAKSLRVLRSNDFKWNRWCEMVLIWEAPVPCSCEWEVYYKCCGEKDWMRHRAEGVFLPGNAVCKFKVTGLESQRTYFFQVRSKDRTSFGNFSRKVEGKTAAAPVCPPTAGLPSAPVQRGVIVDAAISDRVGAVVTPCGRNAPATRPAEHTAVPKRNIAEVASSTSEETDTQASHEQKVKRPKLMDCPCPELPIPCPASSDVKAPSGETEKAVEWVALCMFCSKSADILFPCGHVITCRHCCESRIEVGESRCCACFEIVRKIVPLDFKKGNSADCQLRLKGCAKKRDVALSCGCYKYCANCAGGLSVCLEHRQKLGPKDTISVASLEEWSLFSDACVFDTDSNGCE